MNETDFWNRINLFLKQKKLTQRELSQMCNFSVSRINNLSSTKRLPDAFEVVAIAQALETTVEYLVTGEAPKLPSITDNLKKEILDVLSKY